MNNVSQHDATSCGDTPPPGRKAEAPRSSVSAGAPDGAAVRPPGGKRILIVDDEEGMRKLLQKILRREGYQVDVAEGGPSAIGLAKEQIYDLVLMDLKMPKMKGPDAIRQISEHNPKTQFLVITGHIVAHKRVDLRDELDELVLGGRFGCVFKPFRNEQVVSRIHAMLSDGSDGRTEQ